MKAFWERVNRRGPDECWLWTGWCNTSGYGQLRFNGKRPHAHRVAYMLTRGDIPNGMQVLHHWDPHSHSRAGR